MRTRRKHSIIDKLPPTLKDAVEQMLQADFTYEEIAGFIRDHGYPISTSSVHRYARNLNATIESLRMTQENFRVMLEEINKYPQLDTTEGILRLLSHNLLEAIQNTSEDRWKQVDPEDLMRQSTALIRAAAYKSKVDLGNKDVLEAGFEQTKKMLFDAMMKERPDLYQEVSRFLAEKSEGEVAE